MTPTIDVTLVRALYDYDSKDSGRLSFRKGDTILMLQRLESGWCDGILDQRRGWFPGNFVSEPETRTITPENNFGWIRRNSQHKRREIYYNTLTGETLVYDSRNNLADHGHEEDDDNIENSFAAANLAHVEYRATKLKSTTHQQLPLNWGMKTTSDNRTYYYNKITNETTWNLSDIDPETGVLNVKSRHHYDSHGSVSPTSLKGSNLPDRTTGSPLSNWETLRKDVQNQIDALKASAKAGEKSRYLQDTAAIVQSIQQMMKVSGTLNRDSVLMRSNRMLVIHHKHIMKALSRLVLSSKKASSVWPPPDAVIKMVSEANEVMLSVRHFTTSADEAEIPVRLYDNVPHAQPLPYKGKSKIQHSLDDINDFLESMPQNILRIIKELVTFLEHQDNNFDRGALIQLTRNCVTEVGQLLSVLEDLSLSDVSHETVQEFTKQKQDLYQSITGLVSATTWAVDKMAPEDALQQVLAYTREVSGCSSNAIIAAKYVVEEKQELDEEEFALRFTKDEEKDVEMVPRRALSMNHLSSRRVRSTPRIDTNLKPDLENINENEAMNSPPSPAVHHSVNSTPTSPSVKEEMEENLDEKKASKKKKSLLSIKILSQSAPARRITVDSPISASSKLSKFFGEDMSRNVVTPVDDEWFLSEDIDDQDVLYSMEGNLKGASLPALVVKLTHHGKLDPQLTQAFIMTFHSFTTSREVINQLIARYNVNPPEGLTDDELRIWQERKQRPIRLRVFNVFKLWLESHYFHPNDVSALDAIQSFALSAKESMPTIAEHILKIIEKRRVSADIPIRKLTAVSASSKDLPTPILPRNLKRIRLSDLNSMELARQLTIMESRVYNNIMPYECLDKAWSQKDSLERSPHVKKMIMMTNQITGWVAENILLERDIKQRAQLMKFFISVGDKCRQLHNFNTLMAILAALNSSPIHRLKRTRELLPTKYKAILEEMKQLMQPAQNFSSYRTELRSASPPCVPFLGLYLTDLTFIEDGNSNNIKAMPHMINVDKRIKVAEKIRELMQYQVPQNLMEVPEIQEYLHRELGDGERDADDLYEMSLQLEPREREDEKIARLLQESGFL